MHRGKVIHTFNCVREYLMQPFQFKYFSKDFATKING